MQLRSLFLPNLAPSTTSELSINTLSPCNHQGSSLVLLALVDDKLSWHGDLHGSLTVEVCLDADAQPILA